MADSRLDVKDVEYPEHVHRYAEITSPANITTS
jgi:hypothetical protein